MMLNDDEIKAIQLEVENEALKRNLRMSNFMNLVFTVLIFVITSIAYMDLK